MKEYRVTIDGQVFIVSVEEVEAPERQKEREALPAADSSRERPAVEIKPEPVPCPQPDSALNVEAPMPGSIIDIAVKPGDSVKEGEVLLILEAMKMENEITAPRAGTVSEIGVQVGDTVDGGKTLVVLS